MSANRMPELLSVHGRCPRCGQVLTLPAGQLQNVFRCARCQYRVLGSTLVDEGRAAPLRPKASSGAPVLQPFDEDGEDQRTRVHVPSGDGDEQSELPMPAVLVPATSTPRAAAATLQRFDADADDDQHTRLHIPGSFDAPSSPEPLGSGASASAWSGTASSSSTGSAPAPASASTPPSARVPPPRRSEGPPLARHGGSPAGLSRFEADADDQATRLHLPDGSFGSAPARPGVNGATASPSGGATGDGGALPNSDALQPFDGEDSEDQRTRLQVPISYEEEAPAGAAELRSPVGSQRRATDRDADADAFRQGPALRFGRASLVFTRWIEDWVRDRRAALLSGLAVLCAVIAPLLDVVFGSSRRAATVIAANLVLFFLWTLAFAWLGKLRNDVGAWDARVAASRFQTSLRLDIEDLSRFGALPWPLKWRVVSEVAGALGLAGLGLASALTITWLVWGIPAGDALLMVGRAASAMLVLVSVVAARQAASVPLAFVSSEPTAPAVAHLPAVLDLSLPLSLDPGRAATPVHQLLEVLSQWRPREWHNRDSYLADLERHLMRTMGWARVERERWLGTARAQGIAPLIVNDSVLVEVVRGFDIEAAERVSAQMRMLAKIWRGKPAVIVIFDASRADLMGGEASAPLEALHESYPMLAVRMPSARASLA